MFYERIIFPDRRENCQANQLIESNDEEMLGELCSFKTGQ